MAPPRDRLSLLPESLTTAILSLLPLKDAIRTSVLSRAWCHTWRSRANISIHESHFPSLLHCLYFTRHWLVHYPLATIDRFSLTLTSEPPSDDDQTRPLLEWFIWFALAHETKSLDLDFPAGPTFDLPGFVYEYDGLDDLRLFSCNFAASEFLNITWLKTASLGRVGLRNGALRALLMGCPLLESLSLVECTDETEYTVVSPRMRTLVIDGCVDLLHLTVVAPRLTRFKYVGALIEFEFVGFGAVEEADLDLGHSPFYDEESGESVQCLLDRFRGARVLRVCTYITQVLAMAPNPWKLPREIGAKNLIFKTAFHHYEYVGIACLLISCPTLERLQFDVAPRQIFEDDEDHPCAELDKDTFWGEDLGTPECISSCLKEVEINGFDRSENEVRFLKFLFDFGFRLSTVRLRVARDDGGEWMQLIRDMTRILRSWRYVSSQRPNILIE